MTRVRINKRRKLNRWRVNMAARANIFMIITICLILCGCDLISTKSAPRTNCNLESLIADVTYFPKNTYKDDLISPIPGSANQSMNPRSALMFFTYPSRGVHASQLINQWDDVAQARAKYARESDYLYINDQRLKSPWVTPQQIEFSKSHASEYKVACADLEGIAKPKYRCQLVARYDDYIVWFDADIDPADMSLDHYKNIIYDIDKRFTQCLNSAQTR